MSETTISQLEVLKKAVSGLQNLHHLQSMARDDGLRNINLTWEFWSKGRPELAAAEKKAFKDRFDTVDQEFAKLSAALSGLVGNELQLAKLHEENRQLAAQLAEATSFRTRFQEFMQGA